MKAYSKRTLSILLSVIMVLSVFTAVPFTAGAEDAGNAVTASALYKSHKIEWQSSDEATFTVENSSGDITSSATITHVSADGTYYYTAIVPVATGTEGGETYTVKKNSETVGSATVSEQTGLEALKKNALVAVDYGDAGEVFAGNSTDSVVQLAGPNVRTSETTNPDVIAKLKALSQGSVIYSIATTNSNTSTNSTGTYAVFGSGSFNHFWTGVKSNTFRFSFNNSSTTSTYWGANGAQSGINDGQKHIYAFSTVSGTSTVAASDGANAQSFSGSAKFFSDTEIDRLYLGGLDGTVAGNMRLFCGTIYFALISEEVYTADELAVITALPVDPDAVPDLATGADVKSKTAPSSDVEKNTWAFFGGRDVQGTYAEAGGSRNYVRQFEEAIRWQNNPGSGDATNASSGGYSVNMARFVTNFGATGNDIAKVVGSLDASLAEVNPQTIAYLVGYEDYSKGTEDTVLTAFKENLKSFIEKGLAQRDNTGRVVIQNPYTPADENQAEAAKAYALAVNEVVSALDSTVQPRVLVVNHNRLTSGSAAFASKINESGYLNANGQLEIARELCSAIGLSYSITDSNLSLQLEEGPTVYSDVEVTAVVNSDNTLTFTSDKLTVGDSYTYTVETDSYTLSKTSQYTESGITTAALPQGEEYTLTVTTADGVTQYTVMSGTVAENDKAVKKTAQLDKNQQAIADLMEQKESLTWLFMGDSITHGALWTAGYDSVSQIFEKYIKEELGRTDDVVLNTAVSGATAQSTLNNISGRLTDYSPDVVLIQLGMNDSASNLANFKTQLTQIIDKAQEMGAIVVLRTSTPASSGSSYVTNLATVIQQTREVAATYDNVIFADQFAAFGELTDNASYLNGSSLANYLLLGNAIHPNANGHIVMARTVIESLGFDTYNSAVYNHWYKISKTESTSTLTPSISAAPGKIVLDASELASQYGSDLGYVTLTAADKDGNSFSKTVATASETTVTLSNLENGNYTVSVTAELKATPTSVTFASQQASLSDEMEVTFGVLLSNNIASDLTAGAQIGVLSVSTVAPAGNYTYSLVGENNQNSLFAIDGSVLKIGSQALTDGQTYTIRVRAENGSYSSESDFNIIASAQGLIFREENVEVSTNNGVSLTSKDYASRVMAMDEGTFIIKFTSNSSYAIQSLISVSNNTAGNSNRHFHIYITPAGVIGMESRDNIASGTTNSFTTGAVLNSGSENAIAVKYDKDLQQYKVFANGVLVGTFDGRTSFISNITGLDTVQLGSTMRAGASAYYFGGTIAFAEAYSTPLSDEELIERTAIETAVPNISSGSSISASTMFNSESGNTWVFVGGRVVQGPFSDVGGAKNYVSQFKEYTYDNNPGSADGTNSLTGNPNRERYVINEGQTGRTLADIVEDFDALVTAFDPKAVSYMVGAEDYADDASASALEAFKSNLSAFIEKGLNLRSGTGYVVIQNPYAPADEQLRENAIAYALAVNEVVSALPEDQLARVAVVNHFASTDNASFLSTSLNEDGSLNATGHLSISKQFEAKAIGASSSLTSSNLNLVSVEGPSVYDADAVITATAGQTSLSVALSGVDESTNWNYALTVEGSYTVSCLSGNTAEFKALPAGAEYYLTVCSEDGTTQLTVMQGVIQEGSAAVKYQRELDEQQQQIADLVNGDEPLTWMFMGDSITHGVAMGYGKAYDNIADIFTKYIREDLGRVDDTVINTAVSSATTTSTLARISERLNRYSPDVVSVQLGTNDATLANLIPVATYKANLQSIVDAIEAKGAIAVIRAPIVRLDYNANQPDYVQAAKEVAEENGLIFINQFEETTNLVNSLTYIANGDSLGARADYLFFNSTDNLHPSANGHIYMARMFIDALGLDSLNSAVYNNWYETPMGYESSSIVPQLTVSQNQIELDADALSGAYGQDVAYVFVSAANGSYNFSTSDWVDTDALLQNLPGGTYTVTVQAMLKDTAKTVTFASQNVTIYGTDDVIPADSITATAGSSSVGAGAEMALDDDVNTIWQTDLNGSDRSLHYIILELDGDYGVYAVTYLPSQSDLNGTITKYRIEVSEDGNEWKTVCEGEWSADSALKTASFDTVETKYVKLVSVESYSDSQDVDYSSAAEIRVVGSSAEEQYTLGDVDGNGAVDSADATLVLQRYAEIIDDNYETFVKKAADVDGNNVIDSSDATLILQIYANIISKFPIQQ